MRSPTTASHLALLAHLAAVAPVACDRPRAGEVAGPATPGATPAPAAVTPAPEYILLDEWNGPYDGVPAFDRMDLTSLEPATTGHPAPPRRARGDRRGPGAADVCQHDRGDGASGQTIDRLEATTGSGPTTGRPPSFARSRAGTSPRSRSTVPDHPERAALRPHRRSMTAPRSGRSPQSSAWSSSSTTLARKGATLEGPRKERHAAIQLRLAELHTRFANNVLADEEGDVLYFKEAQLWPPAFVVLPPPPRPRPAVTRASMRSPTPAPRRPLPHVRRRARAS